MRRKKALKAEKNTAILKKEEMFSDLMGVSRKRTDSCKNHMIIFNVEVIAS